MNTVCEVNNLTYSYPDGTMALMGVSFEIEENQCTAIIGSNGAGKSTLLLCLNGIFMPEGEVVLFGTKLTEKTAKELRKRIAIVFQNPDDQLFCTTVYDDIAFGPVNYGLDNAGVEKRVTRALKELKLTGYENRNPYHLSYGEKKRAALATVYSMNPDIYCFDEPTANLDPRGRREIAELIRGIDKTRIVVTHDLDFVKNVCSRVIVLNRGFKEAEGKVKNVLQDTELLFKCGLL